MTMLTPIPTLAGDASFGAYIARPITAAKAAVIVIQEIFGVNEGIRRKCDHWASLGYLAIAPDLFWRLEPEVALDPDIAAEFQQALGLLSRFDQDMAVRDLEAAIRFARSALDGGKVGCVGYCLGGRLAFLCATRTDIDAAVGYYGVGIDGLLGERHAIARPLLLHIPTADHFVGPEAQAAIHAGLDDHDKVTLYDYPGLDHGFAAEMGNRRDDAAARLADARTEAFIADALG